MRYLAPLWGALGFVALWWIVAALKLVDPVLLPSPQDSWRALLAGGAGRAVEHDFLQNGGSSPPVVVIALAGLERPGSGRGGSRARVRAGPLRIEVIPVDVRRHP